MQEIVVAAKRQCRTISPLIDPIEAALLTLSACCTGGGSADPSLNIFLAVTLRKARENGVPKDNIEKALLRVSHVSISEASG